MCECVLTVNCASQYKSILSPVKPSDGYREGFRLGGAATQSRNLDTEVKL